MSDKKAKESSWLLNLFMLIVGAISIMLAVVGYLSPLITLPSWWPFTGPGTLTFMLLIGSLPVGVWMFVGSLGLWKEKAWALGVAFVCFTIILYNGLQGVIQLIIMDPINIWMVWFFWVAFIMVVFSAVGFIYLIVTRNRYH
ncbi:MAG: hypothetical protein GYA24_23335 [Candidatus Lokiarchaeota archaeon]|nr:hypothetical protein [Candidatus Lokiarchaeota archaeon]